MFIDIVFSAGGSNLNTCLVLFFEHALDMDMDMINDSVIVVTTVCWQEHKYIIQDKHPTVEIQLKSVKINMHTPKKMLHPTTENSIWSRWYFWWQMYVETLVAWGLQLKPLSHIMSLVK